MGTRIKISVIERDRGYQAALKAVISTSGDMECVGACANMRKALAELSAAKPDVVLLGLVGEDNGAAKLVAEIMRRSPTAAVVVLAASENSRVLLDCLSSGATGYLLRTDSWAAICEGIRQVRQGGSAFSPRIAQKVVKLFRSMVDPSPVEVFSDREQQIVNLLKEQTRNKEIALALNLSLPTVRTHLRTIYLKLRVMSRAEAIQKLRPAVTPSVAPAAAASSRGGRGMARRLPTVAQQADSVDLSSKVTADAMIAQQQLLPITVQSSI